MPRFRLALLLVLVVLVALPASAGAVLGGVNGRIMFTSGRDTGNSQAGLFMRTIVGSLGSGQVFPAVAPVGGEQARHSSWSPDRRRVVYARGPSPNFDIHIAELTEVADTGITSTSDNIIADRPAWSPDGKKIAWEEGAKTGNTKTDIVVYDVATGTKTNITNTPNDSEGKPAWSPDSQTIWLHHGDPANDTQRIALMSATGGTITDVAGTDITGLNELQPSLSPDGTQICFTVAGTNQANPDVVVGTLPNAKDNLKVLSSDDPVPPNHKGDYNCTWSPDGRIVAYVRGFSTAALVMENATNDPAPITLEDDPAAFDGNPDWAPDGPPKCDDSKAQVIQGKTVRVKMPCHDTGPKYERTDIVETIANDSSPQHGKVDAGKIVQGNPSTIPYTANAKYSGPDSFEFVGLGINGGSDRGLASILVLKKGRCANMKTGNAGHNVLVGTIAGDRLLGLNGKDVLKGLAGRDCLFGGAGNDTLNGGRSADGLKGEDGNDKLVGGGGNDNLNGGKGEDGFDAGKGNDRVNAADGRKETVACGAGKDDRATLDHDDTQHGCEHVTRK